MFSGIVQDIGIIKNIEEANGLKRFTIEAPQTAPDLIIGSSISIDGTCLTVTEKTKDSFVVEAIPETLKRTLTGTYQINQKVNLEKSLKLSDSLDGHLVSGHIDAKGKISNLKLDGEAMILKIDYPKHLAKYFAFKGSVALNGVSLTISKVEETSFEVNIIPHTQKVTNLGQLQKNDEVNIEVDIIARYLERMMNVENLSSM